jgi:hypothetical protein
MGSRGTCRRGVAASFRSSAWQPLAFGCVRHWLWIEGKSDIGFARQPVVLGIYSKFYIPLGDALRPCTKAFVLALLPGLEEDGGEFFDTVRHTSAFLLTCGWPTDSGHV